MAGHLASLKKEYRVLDIQQEKENGSKKLYGKKRGHETRLNTLWDRCPRCVGFGAVQHGAAWLIAQRHCCRRSP
jgi:hypothetical protein